MNAKDLLNNYTKQNVGSNDVKTAERKSKNLGSLPFDVIPDSLYHLGILMISQ